VVAAVIAVLSLGVLAAALVKLAGGSEAQSPASTRTVTTLGAAAPTTTAATVPTPTTSTATTTPGITTPTPGGTAPTSTSTAPGTSGSAAGARERLRIEELRKRTGISTEKLRKLGLLPANR
jgi:hypothetical protein